MSQPEDLTYGFEAVRNRGDRPLTITGVTLEGGRSARAREAALSSIGNTTLVGVQHGWPPPASQASSTFASRRPLPATVGPGETLNLLIRISVEPPADVEGITLTYTAGGAESRATNSTALRVRPSSSSPSAG